MSRALSVSLCVAVALSSVSARAQQGPTLVLGGDVMFEDPIDYALRQMDCSRDDAASYDGLFEELALAQADLAIVNLETPVCDRVRAREDGYDVPVFAAPRAFLEALAHAGVDAVTLANNHAYDQGVGGLAATIANARALGLAIAGSGADRASAFEATLLEARGRRIALVSATEGINLAGLAGEPASPRVAVFDEGLLHDAIARARQRADLVVAMLHWTDAEPGDALPSDEMQTWSARAAEAGADLVVGHGPHVPGPRVTLHTSDGRDVPVLYSLGNLVAAMRAESDEIALPRPSVRDAVLASVHTRIVGGRLAVASIEAVPYFISTQSRRLAGDARSRFIRPLAIDREIARAESAACGRECTELVAAYEARRERIASMFGAVAAPVPISPTPAPTPTPAPAPALSPSPAPAPSPATVDLGLSFAPHSARELSHDDGAVHALADRLRADHRLRVSIVAHPGPDESAALASRRAHHARGLLSVLGPSRSRFDLSVGDPSPDGRVEISVVPTAP